MPLPSSTLADAVLIPGDKQGISTPGHRTRHNNLVAHVAAIESGIGLEAVDGSELTYALFSDDAGHANYEPQSRKPLNLNGDFQVWQRGTTSSTDGVYTADRYRTSFGSGGSPAYTVSRQSHTLGDIPGEPEFFFRFNQTAQATANPPTFEQRIPNVRTGANQKVTFSAYLRCASGTVVVYPQVIQNFGSGGSPSSAVQTTGTPQSINTSWVRHTFTLTVPSVVGKTLGSTAKTSYLSTILSLPTSATYQLDISRFRVELGASSSTPLSQSDEDVLVDCLPFCEVIQATAVNGSFASGNVSAATSGLLTLTYFPKRLAPVLSVSAVGDFVLSDSGAAPAVTVLSLIGANTAGKCTLSVTAGAGGLTTGRGANLLAANTNATLTLANEL